MRTELEEQYRAFVASASVPLRRFAFLLCSDWHLAEDLTQTALLRLYRHWPRIGEVEAINAYARKALLRCWLSEQRRAWRRAETRTGVVPDSPDALADPATNGHAPDYLLTALAQVPPRQRAVLVLRYFVDLSVTETAAAMRCSEGTVKSQAARGLAQLRATVDVEGTLS